MITMIKVTILIWILFVFWYPNLKLLPKSCHRQRLVAHHWDSKISIYPAPGFNADLAIKSIEKRNATHLIGTPTMFNDIVNSPIRKNHDISSLSYAIVGGSPATPALVRNVFKFCNTKNHNFIFDHRNTPAPPVWKTESLVLILSVSI